LQKSILSLGYYCQGVSRGSRIGVIRKPIASYHVGAPVTGNVRSRQACDNTAAASQRVWDRSSQAAIGTLGINHQAQSIIAAGGHNNVIPPITIYIGDGKIGTGLQRCISYRSIQCSICILCENADALRNPVDAHHVIQPITVHISNRKACRKIPRGIAHAIGQAAIGPL